MKESILDLIKYKELNLADYNDVHELREALDYDGSLHQLIDNSIEIYNYQLRQWAVDNYHYIEEAINEGLVDTSGFDFHKAIQSGQFLQLTEEANEALEAIFNEFQESSEVDNA